MTLLNTAMLRTVYIFCFVLLLGFSSAYAASRQISKSKGEVVLRTKKLRVFGSMVSFDRRHKLTVTLGGWVQLDGGLVQIDKGALVGLPVWRRDSGAVAFLWSSSRGSSLVVVSTHNPTNPLVWNLTDQIEPLEKIFWVSPNHVGIGNKTSDPKVVVSWTPTVVGQAQF